MEETTQGGESGKPGPDKKYSPEGAVDDLRRYWTTTGVPVASASDLADFEGVPVSRPKVTEYLREAVEEDLAYSTKVGRATLYYPVEFVPDDVDPDASQVPLDAFEVDDDREGTPADGQELETGGGATGPAVDALNELRQEVNSVNKKIEALDQTIARAEHGEQGAVEALEREVKSGKDQLTKAAAVVALAAVTPWVAIILSTWFNATLPDYMDQVLLALILGSIGGLIAVLYGIVRVYGVLDHVRESVGESRSTPDGMNR